MEVTVIVSIVRIFFSVCTISLIASPLFNISRNFSAPGAGEGTTGFSGSNTGHGTPGFDRTGGKGDGSGSGNFTSNPNETISGFSRNDPAPDSAGANFEAPGTGTQKTGFSNIESGTTGFEGDSGSGAGGGGGGFGESNSSSSGGGVKEKLSELKDRISRN